MSHSKYEYVRDYEKATEHILLNNSWIVVRVDGKRFHHFSDLHNFYKPNDRRSLDLMIEASKFVINEYFPNIIFAYGQSDEFSFIFRRKTKLYNRRQSKLTSLIASSFTSAFIFNWNKFFTDTSLQCPPIFDSRCVLYPTDNDLIDYLRWRQVDCHINNLYNTTFHAVTGQYCKWSLEDKVKPALKSEDNEIFVNSDKVIKNRSEATKYLSKTVSSDKHEILFTHFNINYNNELEQFKKGSFLICKQAYQYLNDKKLKSIEPLQQSLPIEIEVNHYDIINDNFWQSNKLLID